MSKSLKRLNQVFASKNSKNENIIVGRVGRNPNVRYYELGIFEANTKNEIFDKVKEYQNYVGKVWIDLIISRKLQNPKPCKKDRKAKIWECL